MKCDYVYLKFDIFNDMNSSIQGIDVYTLKITKWMLKKSDKSLKMFSQSN